MDASLPYYLGFSHFLGIGPVKLNALLKQYKINDAYLLSERTLTSIIGQETSRRFVQFRDSFNPQKKLQELISKKITVLSRVDPRYPEQLRELSDAPICIYVKGDDVCLTKPNTFQFAVVGTRKASTYGLKTTRDIVEEICRRSPNTCIVSGLAYGVDTVAHEVALKSGVRTVAFLGCGVDIVYPYGNKGLYERIVAGGGAVVSEFPPGQTVVPGLFIARNRLISGLSRGILVVEGSKTSGALITARYAAEQGKDTFALPGQIQMTTSEAPNLLIKEGAIIVTSVSDIPDFYGFGVGASQKDTEIVNLSLDERTVLSCLEKSPKLLDELVRELSIPAQEAMVILSRLELEGIVDRRSDEKYSVK